MKGITTKELHLLVHTVSMLANKQGWHSTGKKLKAVEARLLDEVFAERAVPVIPFAKYLEEGNENVITT